jgi:hypothetical protein
VEVEILAPTENAEANRVRAQIATLVEEIRNHESSLVRDFAKLGTHLLTVREQKFWILWDFKSFGQYLAGIQNGLGKGRAQLYQAISVVEKLLPEVTEGELAQMGISKAIALRKAIDPSGHVSPELVKLALDPKITIEDLRGEIYKACNLVAEEDGSWLDLGGIFVTAAERAELKRADDVACRTDPIIPRDISDHIRRKEIRMRQAQEYLATYEGIVERGEQ